MAREVEGLEHLDRVSNHVMASSPGRVPATPNFKAQSKNYRSGRDESAFTRVFDALLPGHDPGEYRVLRPDRNPL